MMTTKYEQSVILARLAVWSAIVALRDELIRDAYNAEIKKFTIHRITGVARTTIDHILETEKQQMINIWDVLHRIVDSKPMSELEQGLAHRIISEHQAAETVPVTEDPAGELPDPTLSPSSAPEDTSTSGVSGAAGGTSGK